MTFLLASQNRNKLAELRRILEPLGVNVITPSEAGVDLFGVQETGSTFIENARIKAVHALGKSGMPSIGDDSGLEVRALNNAPGIYSARYAGENATDQQRIEKLLGELKDVPKENRQARFVCAICCAFPDGDEIVVRETCEGSIAFEPNGSGGFGYDPIFIVQGRSFAELSSMEKDIISHRGKALRALREALQKRLQGKE